MQRVNPALFLSAMVENQHKSNLEMAKALIEAGARPVPAQENKEPIPVAGWNKKDYEKKHFDAYPAIGVRTGEDGNGLVALDLDDVVAQNFLTKTGVQTLTIGRNGDERKAFFIISDLCGRSEGLVAPPGREKGTIIEILANGRHGIIPPSVWVDTHDVSNRQNVKVINAVQPMVITWDWFLKLYISIRDKCALELGISLPSEKISIDEIEKFKRMPEDAKDRPGSLFDADPSISIGDILERNEWRFMGTRSISGRIVEDWQRPGKKPHESHSVTIGYYNGFMYTWTSSTVFEQRHAYRKHQVLAFLEYGGDFSAMAKDLSSKGYKTDPQPFLEDKDVKDGRYTITDTNIHMIAEELNKEIRIMRGPKDETYYYDGKIWRSAKESQLRSIISERLNKWTKIYLRREVLGHVIDLVPTRFNDIRFNIIPHDCIALLDGIYSVTTGELMNHHHEHMLDAIIPHCLPDLSQKAPDALIGIFRDQNLNEQEIKTIQEFFGYCLFLHCDYKYALFIVGVRDTGKSTLIRVLEQMVGSENTSSVPLSGLGDARQMAPLQGAIVNLVPESDGKVNSAGFKVAVSGGDTVRIDQKNIPAINYKLMAKHVFACNETPDFEADDDPVWGRLLLIRFRNTIAKLDGTIEQRIIDDMPSVLSWAIQGARRLIQAKGSFSTRGEAADEHDTAKSLDYTMQWIGDELRPSPSENAVFRDVWEMFCRASGKKPDDESEKRKFSRKIKAAGYSTVKSNSKVLISSCTFASVLRYETSDHPNDNVIPFFRN